MRPLIRPLLLISLVLLVPLVPFLLFGPQVEAWVSRWQETPPSPAVTALLVIGLLATDIFLPIPSSMVSTLAGWQLDWHLGTLTSWIGMNLGAILGFGLARRWGRRFALGFARREDLGRLEDVGRRFGPVMLVFLRGVPVLAEASVLLMGIEGLAWRRFLPAVLLSNLGIALAYSLFGSYAEQHEWLPLALGISIALPVLLAALVRAGLRIPAAR